MAEYIPVLNGKRFSRTFPSRREYLDRLLLVADCISITPQELDISIRHIIDERGNKNHKEYEVHKDIDTDICDQTFDNDLSLSTTRREVHAPQQLSLGQISAKSFVVTPTRSVIP